MADYDLIELNELTEQTTPLDSDIVHIQRNTGGSWTDHKMTYADFKTKIGNFNYTTGIFNNTDLSGGVFLITHGKQTTIIRLTIVDPDGLVQFYPYTIVDSNNISVDFGGDIANGDFTYILEYFNEGAASVVDPVLNTSTKNAALTINDYNFKRFGNVIVCYLDITTSSSFDETSGGGILGVLNVAPANTIKQVGTPYVMSVTDHCYCSINSGGQIRIFLNKILLMNGRGLFNLTFITA